MGLVQYVIVRKLLTVYMRRKSCVYLLLSFIVYYVVLLLFNLIWN